MYEWETIPNNPKYMNRSAQTKETATIDGIIHKIKTYFNFFRNASKLVIKRPKLNIKDITIPFKIERYRGRGSPVSCKANTPTMKVQKVKTLITGFKCMIFKIIPSFSKLQVIIINIKTPSWPLILDYFIDKTRQQMKLLLF